MLMDILCDKSEVSADLKKSSDKRCLKCRQECKALTLAPFPKADPTNPAIITAGLIVAEEIVAEEVGAAAPIPL